MAFEPTILGFLCNWCSYAGADLAGVSRIQYAPNIRIVRIMCSGRVDPIFITQAFLKGVDGIIVLGCHLGDCHYMDGNYEAEIKMAALIKLLKMADFSERFRLDWVSASEGSKFAQIINEFTEHIRKIGPSPFRNGALENGLVDEFKAITNSLSDNRLRALIARQRAITTKGNVYNEIIPKEEFDAILNTAIYDEFIRNKILVKIKNKGKSVPQISKEIDLEPHLILNHIVELRSKGLVDVEKIMETVPLFISTN